MSTRTQGNSKGRPGANRPSTGGSSKGKPKKGKQPTDPRNPKGRRVMVLKDGRRKVFEWVPW